MIDTGRPQVFSVDIGRRASELISTGSPSRQSRERHSAAASVAVGGYRDSASHSGSAVVNLEDLLVEGNLIGIAVSGQIRQSRRLELLAGNKRQRAGAWQENAQTFVI